MGLSKVGLSAGWEGRSGPGRSEWSGLRMALVGGHPSTRSPQGRVVQSRARRESLCRRSLVQVSEPKQGEQSREGWPGIGVRCIGADNEQVKEVIHEEQGLCSVTAWAEGGGHPCREGSPA